MAALAERLRQAADRCCQAEEGFEAMDASSKAFLDLLETPLHDQKLKEGSVENWLAECEQALQQAGELLDPSASASGLVLCERIGLDLPKVVVKFVTLSEACQDHCLSIIEVLAENCNPREMFTAFMEALSMYTAPRTLICCIPLVQGLSMTFSRLQRRHVRFLQEAASGLLPLLRLTLEVEGDEDDEEEEDATTSTGIVGENLVPPELVHAAILENVVQFAQVVRELFDTVEVPEQLESLQRKLGLFALHILGINVEKIAQPDWEVPAPVMELVALLPHCGLSIPWLLTKSQIEIFACTEKDIYDDQSKIEATKGAALAAYWALSNNNNQGAEAASSVEKELQATGRKGVVAALTAASLMLTGSSSRPLSSVPAFGLTLFETILKLASSVEFSADDEYEDDCVALPLQILPTLQRLQNVVVYAPSLESRRQGYAALRKVIQEILPPVARLRCLQMLISNCLFPSLVALHLTIVRDEVNRAWPSSQGSTVKEGQQADNHVASPFVSKEILEVIGDVLRPKTGAPPQLPAEVDSVLNALNLYRFILIRESAGKTNYTGVLSKEALTKARKQWLLPLRELVGGVSLGLVVEDNEMAADMSLAIDTLQSVVTRCLELNEEALARL